MSRPVLFLEQDLEGAVLVPVAGGEVAVYTHRSPEDKGVNEDAAAVLDLGPGAVVLAVADGMGGGAAGHRAAALAVEHLTETVRRDVEGGQDLRHAVLDGFEAANRAVAALQTGSRTTLAVAALAGTDLRTFHAGDTAVLQVGQRGRIKLATLPHSPTGYAVEAGLLKEKEALVHEERHVVSNVVGEPEMSIQMTGPRSLAPRDSVLIGSDGLFDNLTTGEVAAAIRKGPTAAVAGELARRCRARMQSGAGARPGKPDDLTLLLYRRARPAVRPPVAGTS